MMSKRPSKRPGLRTLDRAHLARATGGNGQVIQSPSGQTSRATIGVWTPWGIQQVPLDRPKPRS